jgi:predicted GTPase
MSKDIIEILRSIDEAVSRCSAFPKEAVNSLYKDMNLDTASEMEKFLADFENKQLTVGIIGIVKSGKSTLLNSLFFEGKEVLPTAGTPMTSAITSLTYGEKPSITVEYFTDDEIKKIKEKHDSHKSSGNDNKAAFDQYEGILKNPEVQNKVCKKRKEETPYETMEEIENKLYDYVGDDGPFVPFTKAVEVRANSDTLRGIFVVDTPGLNDPVEAREERTKEFLKKCDVVFIISKASGFITASDKTLIDRLVSGEGIRELYFIATQSDTAVIGKNPLSESESLEKARNAARNNLKDQAKTLLDNLIRESGEIKDRFQKVLENIDGHFFFVSAACYTMHEHFDDRNESWNENQKNIWKQLQDYDKKDFTEDKCGKEALALLIGKDIEKIKEKIGTAEKDRIIALRKQDYLEAKKKIVDKFKQLLCIKLKNKQDELIETASSTIDKEQEKFVKYTQEYAGEIDKKTFNPTDAKKAMEGFIKNTIKDTREWLVERGKKDNLQIQEITDKINCVFQTLCESIQISYMLEYGQWEKEKVMSIFDLYKENDTNTVKLKHIIKNIFGKIKIPDFDFTSMPKYHQTGPSEVQGNAVKTKIADYMDYLERLEEECIRIVRKLTQIEIDKLSDLIIKETKLLLPYWKDKAKEEKKPDIDMLEKCIKELGEIQNAS